MAQNIWINVMVDTTATNKHGSTGGSAAAGDVTFSYDSAKLTSLFLVDAVIASIRQRLLAAGFK